MPAIREARSQALRQSLRRNFSAVLEVRYHTLAIIRKVREAMPEMKPFRRQAVRHGMQQIRAVSLITGGALYGCAERRAL